MPMPKPKPDESKDDFLDRCMGDDVMNDEYPDEKQRYAICNDIWKKEKKDKEDDMEDRKAIKSHKTATSDKSWDGPANEGRLKVDQDASYYHKAYAWQDPDGDETKKNAYKFIHHEVSGDGTPGAANIKGCQSAIGVLNGARGGTTIPDADRKGVWNHLASHLKDADVEPAELKSLPVEMERRCVTVEELRVIRSDGEPPKIVGYSAVFNKLSEPLGFFGETFQEKIAPGAFKNALKKSDTRALFNHDPNIILGRQSAGTLKLKEDEKGLFMEAVPPDTQYVRDVVLTPIERGDIKEQSFGFTVKTDQWEENKEKKTVIRTLIEIDTLFDVSPVTFPAYPDTSVALRSMEQWRNGNKQDPHTEPPEATLDGWEDITSADADEARKQLNALSDKLRRMEVMEL